jgi:sec-independent protein translocase protein TatC
VVSGRALGTYRPWIVVATFVFAAVATPSTDPFTMLVLAVPMTMLFLLSEVIARLVDRRRASASFEGLDDDVASGIDDDLDDVRPSGLGEDED